MVDKHNLEHVSRHRGPCSYPLDTGSPTTEDMLFFLFFFRARSLWISLPDGALMVNLQKIVGLFYPAFIIWGNQWQSWLSPCLGARTISATAAGPTPMVITSLQLLLACPPLKKTEPNHWPVGFVQLWKLNGQAVELYHLPTEFSLKQQQQQSWQPHASFLVNVAFTFFVVYHAK